MPATLVKQLWLYPSNPRGSCIAGTVLCELLGLLSAWRLLVAVTEAALLLLSSREGWLSSVQSSAFFYPFSSILSHCYLNSILLINFMSSSAVSKTYINLYHLSTSFIKPFNLCKAFLPGHQRDCVLAADRAAFPPAASNELSNTVPHSFLSTSPSPNKRRQGKEKKPKMVKRKQRKWK